MRYNKLIGIVLILLILLVPSALAADWDNVKSFTPDDGYGKISITNWLGLGSTIAEFTLEENSDACLEACYAEGTVTLYSAQSIFNAFEYRNIKNDLITTSPNITIFIERTKQVTYLVQTGGAICELVDNPDKANSTKVNQCSAPTYGEAEKTVKYWDEYDGEELEEGTYNWRIEGTKERYQTVDWIAEALGTKFTEWAWWGTYDYRYHIGNKYTNNYPISVNDTYGVLGNIVWIGGGNISYVYSENTNYGGAINYGNDTGQINWQNDTRRAEGSNSTGVWSGYNRVYHFSNGEGNRSATGSNDATLLSANTINLTDGVFGESVNNIVDDANSRISLGVLDEFRSGEDYTVSMWFKPTSFTCSTHCYMFDTAKTGTGFDVTYRLLLQTTTGKIQFSTTDGSGTSTTILGPLASLNTWQHIGIVKKEGFLFLYYNGEKINETFELGNDDFEEAANTHVGADGSGTQHFVGQIDELRIIEGGINETNFWRTAYYNGINNLTTLGAEEEPSVEDYSWGARNITITPTTAYTNNTLTVTWDVDNSTNWGGTPENYTIVDNRTLWYQNGVVNTSLTNLTTLTTAMTSKGDIFKVNVSLNNGTSWSDWDNSSNLTILNIIPSTPTAYTPNTTQLVWQPTINLSCSGSTDLDGDTINYEFWANDTGLVLQQNNTLTTYRYTFDNGNGTYQWNCRANDGSSTSAYATGNVSLVYNNTIFTQTQYNHTWNLYSGQNSTYSFNVSYNGIRVDRVTGVLSYRNTTYSVTGTNVTGLNKTTFSTNIYTPIVPGNYTETLYWNITAYYTNGSSNEFSYSYAQNIKALATSTGCTPGGTTYAIVNFTVYQETNDTHMAADVEGNLTIWIEGDRNNNFTLGFDATQANSTVLCVIAPNNYTIFRSDGQIRYEVTDHDPRDYYFIYRQLTNVTDYISLYSLPILLADGISFTVEDQSGNSLEDRYIVVKRYDVGSDSYKTVTIIKTDDDGAAYAFLRKYDTEYQFQIQNYSTVVFISDNRKITTDSLTFTVSSATLSQYLVNFDTVSGVLTFNNVTNVFTAAFSGASGVTDICLSVVKYAWNNNTEFIADSCTTDATGTITVNVSAYGNGTYIATLYTKEEGDFVEDILEVTVGTLHDLENLVDNLGREGGVLSLFLFILVVTTAVATGSVTYTIIAGLFALVVLVLIGFTAVSLMALIGMMIVGGVILYLRR